MLSDPLLPPGCLAFDRCQLSVVEKNYRRNKLAFWVTVGFFMWGQAMYVTSTAAWTPGPSLAPRGAPAAAASNLTTCVLSGRTRCPRGATACAMRQQLPDSVAHAPFG